MIIPIAVRKGGNGKSTTTNALAFGLISKGYKVLVIDIDSQRNQNISFNFFEEPEHTLYDVLMFQAGLARKGPDIKDCILTFGEGKPDLIPAIEDLTLLDSLLPSRPNSDYFFRDAIEPIKNQYDFILIDCPPSLNYLPLSVLNAADSVLIPVTLESLPVRGVSDFINQVSKQVVATGINPKLEVLGVLVTMANTNPILSRGLLEEIKEQLGDLVFDTMIRRNIALSEAQHMGQDIFSYAPESNGAKDYLAFTDEFLSRVRNGKG